jgi:hypothetical protein
MTEHASSPRPVVQDQNAGTPQVARNDSASSNSVVRNPAPDAAAPTVMPQIYGSFTLSR